MKRLLLTASVLMAPLEAAAAGFDRPIPQPQTDTAEFWFLIASLALIGALGFVQYLVSRR